MDAKNPRPVSLRTLLLFVAIADSQAWLGKGRIELSIVGVAAKATFVIGGFLMLLIGCAEFLGFELLRAKPPSWVFYAVAGILIFVIDRWLSRDKEQLNELASSVVMEKHYATAISLVSIVLCVGVFAAGGAFMQVFLPR